MNDRVVKAISNIFKEAGHKVISITENTITTRKFEERMGLKAFEKSIQSYQDLNITVTID